MQATLLVMVGGAAGAALRYWSGRALFLLLGAGFPWGTLSVNLLGGLAMGVLAGTLALHPSGSEEWRQLLGVGLLGGFTTFSAFSLDVVMLAERGALVVAGAYILLSVAGALAALLAGLALARALA